MAPSLPASVTEVFDAALADDPGREALVARSGRWTYAALDEACARAAAALADLGVAAGDRVAGCLPNDVDVVVAFHAAMRLGAIWVGVNRALAPPEKQYLLEDSGASLLMCEAETAASLPSAGVRCVPAEQWHEAWTSADPLPRRSIDPDAPAGIAYTSGTTGFPKGAVHSQRNLLVPGHVLVSDRGWDAGMRKGDCLPLTILNMLVLTTLLVPQSKGCCVLMDRIDATGATEWIEREAVSVFNGPPPMLHSMEADPEITPARLGSLREVFTGGADCPEALRARFESKFGLPVLTSYGLSEAPTVVSIDPVDGEHREGMSGRVLPHLDVRIVDGEVCVAGKADGLYRPMLGYWGKPEASAAAVRDGVLHTGDLGSVTDDGWLAITDRKNLVILRGGANVYPAEVERVLAQNPGVAGSAVIGLGDERLGERVVAVVERQAGASVSEDDLRTLCAEHLAKYKVPERIAFVEKLPRNSMGKVIRRELPDLFA